MSFCLRFQTKVLTRLAEIRMAVERLGRSEPPQSCHVEQLETMEFEAEEERRKDKAAFETLV